VSAAAATDLGPGDLEDPHGPHYVMTLQAMAAGFSTSVSMEVRRPWAYDERFSSASGIITWPIVPEGFSEHFTGPAAVLLYAKPGHRFAGGTHGE